MNLIAATTENEEATNQVYNVAVGDSASLNELCEYSRSHLAKKFPHLKDFKPTYRICEGLSRYWNGMSHTMNNSITENEIN